MTLVGKSFYVFLVGVFFSLVGCSENNSHSNFNEILGYAQGTTFKVVYEDSLHRDFSHEIDSILNDFDRALSLYVDSSELLTLNNSKNQYHHLNKNSYLKNCIKQAKSIYEFTDGAFNPAIYPLVKYWGFSSSTLNESIEQNTIDSILQITSFSDTSFFLIDSTSLDENSVLNETTFLFKLNPFSQLDFNAIAQGYSVDVVSSFLESRGSLNFMVEIGGEVVCRGINPSNEQWKIGIDQPIENSMPGQYDFQCVVKLDNRALATSGNYRKFYKKNGVKYAHTIDPHTGYPVSHSLLSVSVLASDAATADGFATAFMVMGEEKAISFIKSNPKLGLDAYFVVGKKDGNSIQMTEGMRDYLVN